MPFTDPALTDAARGTSAHLRFGLSHRDSAQNYFAWQARQFAARGKVLDHGAGSGALAVALLREGVQRLVALEPEAELAGQMRARFSNEPAIEVFQGTAEDYLAHAGPGSIDSVVTSNVLEHIADDSACLRTIFELLAPGGKLGVYVPARMELFGSLDDAVGHVRRYHAPELRGKLTRAGFVIDELRYCNLLGVLPWFVAGRVLKQAEVGGEGHRLFDRVFPICAAIEQRLHVPYGLNLLALVRKPR